MALSMIMGLMTGLSKYKIYADSPEDGDVLTATGEYNKDNKGPGDLSDILGDEKESKKIFVTTTKKVVKVKRAKIKKVVRKKKKIKISVKKISGVKGYIVQISKKKNFKKNYIILKKTVSKAKLVKKAKWTLKFYKKYKRVYIRVRAYKIYNNKKYLGRWSKIKKSI